MTPGPIARAPRVEVEMSRLKKTSLCVLWSLACISSASSTFGQMRPSSVGWHFAVGQEWSLKSGAGAPAKIVIGMVESLRGKRVVSVSIIDIPLYAGRVQFSTIADAPFDEAALRASVDRLIGVKVPSPDGFVGGYDEWKQNRGGVYTVTVGEVIRLAQRQL